MIVTTLAGASEIITDYTQLSRKRRVNGEQSLSFLLPKTDRNAHSFDLVAEESVVEYDGISYRIKGLVEQTKGKPIKSITAYHVFFDLVDEFRYNVLTTGYKSLHEVMSFIFADTDYTFAIIDTFASQEFENFGNDNCLALFQKVLDRYQAEYELIGNQVRIKEKIGANIDFQFRYGFNIKTFKRTVNTSNLSTYIKGTGKLNEDGTPIVEGEYTSPMAAIYGIRHAPPYSNETITESDTLTNYLKVKIQDTPEVSIELEFVSLQEQGYPAKNANMGDVVPTIYEPLNVDLDLRIIEIEDYPEAKRSPKVTLSTVPKAFVNAVMDYQKNLMDKIYDPTTNRARYNVLPDAIKRATEALQSAQTELEFTNGIIARSKDNANHLVLLNSNGIGISRDGGQTFTEAITSDGFVLSAGAIGVLAANHIQIGAQTTYDEGYDPITKETPEGAQEKAEAAVKVGEIFVRGSGLERTANRLLKINGNTIYDQGTGRGIRFTVLRKTDLGVLEDVVRDTYENESDRNDLAGKINWYCDNDTDVIFVLSSFDAIGWNDYLATAVRRIGGASFPWNRTPYALIGIPNIGEGAGMEVVTSTSANAPHAEISTKVIDGVPYGIDTSKLALVTKVRDDLRMTAALPTSLAMNQDGITAYTADSNKYARMDYRGFYAKQGAFAVERPDGYLSVQDGILRNSFTIQGSYPAFKTLAVEEFGQFYRTKSDARLENIQRFVFKHDSRYLRIIANMFCDAGEGSGYNNVGNIAFDVVSEDESTSITSVVVTEARHSDNQGYRKDILLDLGTPTGNLLVVYWRMWNAIAGWYTYGSVRYLVAEG